MLVAERRHTCQLIYEIFISFQHCNGGWGGGISTRNFLQNTKCIMSFVRDCRCIPRPFRRRNPAESHLSISSCQGFWRRNLVHYALAAVDGASDHKFSKYDGMKAVVFFTLLFSVLFLGLSPESVITLPCVLSHFHQHHPDWSQ